MTTYYYSIEFAHNTYTGEVEGESGEQGEHKAQDYAELITVDRIVEDYGYCWNEAAEQLEAHGKVTMSLTPIEAPRPVLHNMLTGEKIVGEPGMSECQLFGMMAAGW